MKVGQIEYFCNCLLKNLKEHVVAKDSEGRCVYCGHHAIKRAVTDSDIRCNEKHGAKLEQLKREHLEIIIKDRRHNEKVN